MMKIQILYIHGGMTFKNREDYLNYLKSKQVSTIKRISWSGDYLEKSLGKKYEVITPECHCRTMQNIVIGKYCLKDI